MLTLSPAARRAPAAAAMTNFTDFSADVNNSDLSANASDVDVFMEQVANLLNVYYTPVLIVLGSVGNLVSVVVFYRSKLRLQSTSQYLSALALSDTIFLCQLLPPWLKAVEASPLFSRNGFCQLFVYLSYVTSNYSSWLVVAFTLERFVAVLYPLQRNAMCTVKRARHIILSLAALALIVNVPVLRFAVPRANDCNIDEALIDHAARFNVVDTLISFTLPLAVIVVLNTWIMVGVYRLGRTRGHLVRQQRAGRPCHQYINHQGPTRHVAWQRSQQRVTRMLLIVSSVFVLLNLPAYSMRIAAYANNMGEHEYSGKWAALQQICLLFFNTNFGINFFLYCMSGQNFQHALCQTFPWLSRGRGAVAIGTASQLPARASSVSTSFAHSFSNHTEPMNTIVSSIRAGTSNRAGRSASDPEACKRQRRRRVIQRWRFDNTKQRSSSACDASCTLELQPLPRQPEESATTGAAAQLPPDHI